MLHLPLLNGFERMTKYVAASSSERLPSRQHLQITKGRGLVRGTTNRLQEWGSLARAPQRARNLKRTDGWQLRRAPPSRACTRIRCPTSSSEPSITVSIPIQHCIVIVPSSLCHG